MYTLYKTAQRAVIVVVQTGIDISVSVSFSVYLSRSPLFFSLSLSLRRTESVHTSNFRSRIKAALYISGWIITYEYAKCDMRLAW